MHRFATILVLALSLGACTGVRLLPAVPEANYEQAQIPGFSNIRFWGDEAPEDLDEIVAEVRAQVQERIRSEGRVPNNGRLDILVLSGGGSDGAYGAGLLNGWSARGDRPEFSLVTGISTGALIAPYAFLGPDFDDDVERFYTNIRTADVLSLDIFKALTGRRLGLADTGGLFRTIDSAVTDELVRLIAEEHAKGRRLWVGTTNLDAQRPVIWRVSAIAASGDPGARELIRDILIASASIPGAFPPEQISVQVDGRYYSEMHVDGGVTRQLFVFPEGILLSRELRSERRPLQRGTIYAVRNTKLHPDYVPTAARVIDIATRSMSTLIKFAGVADVRVLEDQAEREGFGLKVTSVPEDFDMTESELFDPVYMRALFDIGYEAALTGDAWTTRLEARE